jgi:hypothetical protein
VTQADFCSQISQVKLECRFTASINRSNTGVRPELKHPCSTGDRTDPVRPKRSPAGRTGLSDQCLAGPVRPVRHPARPVPTDQSKLVDRCPPIRSGWSTSLYRSDQSDRPVCTGRVSLVDQLVDQSCLTGSLVERGVRPVFRSNIGGCVQPVPVRPVPVQPVSNS